MMPVGRAASVPPGPAVPVPTCSAAARLDVRSAEAERGPGLQLVSTGAFPPAPQSSRFLPAQGVTASGAAGSWVLIAHIGQPGGSKRRNCLPRVQLCSLATYVCAVIYCPSMSLGGPSAPVVHTKQNNLLLPHRRCRGVSCIPAFTSYLQLQPSCPVRSLGITSSPNCSPFSPSHSSPALHTIRLCRFRQMPVEKDRKPQHETTAHLASFRAGATQWPPTTQW